MALLKDLIVNGASRFLGPIYGTASNAITAANAIEAASAGFATSASYANCAANAIAAGSAGFATSASYANCAANAISAGSAGFATSSSYANCAANAIKAGSAGFAISATYANCAANATNAGSATSASNATLAGKANAANLTTVDNTVPRFDGAAGTFLTSSVTIDDSNNINTTGNLTANALYVFGTSTTDKTNRFITSSAASNVYISVAGVIPFLAGSTEIRSALAAAGTINLGSSSVKWKNIYSLALNTMSTFTAITSGRGDLGSSTSPRYLPYKWYASLGFDPADGDIIVVKMPSAGNTAGVWLSINGNTDAKYHPIAISTTDRLTTHYSNGNIIMLVYQSALSASVYALAGADAVASVTGIWRIINYRDTNTNTLLRTYVSGTNINVPLIGLSSAASGTAAWTSYTSSYKDWYGVIPNVDANRAKINLSTGLLTVPGGITSSTITATNVYGAKASGTATLASSSWTDDTATSGWWKKNVAITGIVAADNVHITPIYTLTAAGQATRLIQQKEWQKYEYGITYAGGFTFYFKSAPSVDLPFAWEKVK